MDEQELPGVYRDRRRLAERSAPRPTPGERIIDSRLFRAGAVPIDALAHLAVRANYESATDFSDEALPAFESVPAGPLDVCDVKQLNGSPGESGRFKSARPRLEHVAELS